MVGPRPRALSVLYVSETYTPHDRRFLAAVRDRVARVAWLCVGDPARGGETREVEGVERIATSAADANEPDATRVAVVAAAARVRPDVVHAGPVPTVGLGAVRARVAPAVVMAWGSDVLRAAEQPVETVARVTEALRGASGFVGDAACVERTAESLGLSASAPRAIFPWGLEAERRRPPAATSGLRERLGWKDAHVVVSTRAWSRAYDVGVLVDAYRLAAARDPRLRFLLLGDGPEAPALRRALASHLERGEVVCPGLLPEPDVRAHLEAADVYWSAVPSDGSSISLLEAMALERPPVVVDAFGNREWVESGRTGWLFRVGDAPAAAAALEAAFADDARRRRTGAAAREVVLARARWEDNVERLVDLYRTVAA